MYKLSKDLIFPHPSLADEDGVLAFGGDLSTSRLLLAYRNGIFPWYSEGEPIIWHSPDPRFVLFPENVKISKSLRSLIKKQQYQITIDQDFESVIYTCRDIKREWQDGTWITDEMTEAYIDLHQRKYAHSVEVWNHAGKLVGGLYGVNIGTIFYGELMFHVESNTSKLALAHLATQFDFSMIDCQVYTSHLESLGAESISLESFLKVLAKECEKPSVL